MTSSVGHITFGVGADASGMSAQLQAALTPALAKVQTWLDQRPLEVSLEADITGLLNRIQRRLDRADLKATVNLDIDVAGAITAAQTALAAADLKIEVKVDVDTASLPTTLDRRMREIARNFTWSVKVKVEPDFSTFPRQMNAALESMQRLFDWRMDIPVGIDSAAAIAQMAALRRALEGMLQPPLRQEVDVDADRAGRSVGSLSRNLGRLAGSAAGIAAVTAAIAAITGAAGAAAGAVGGLVVAASALGPAFGAIASTAVLGLQGVGDAFSALGDLSANAAADARAQTEAVSAAQDALTSATDSAQDASYALADAQKASADAAEDVAEAYRTAEERLASYQDRLAESSLNEREARLNLAEAQQALGEAMKSADPLDRERALLRVERAELNLRKTQKDNVALQEEANEELRKGVEGSEEVVAAKEAQARADRQLEQAERGVIRANEAVAKAAEQLAKAQSGAGTSSEKFADALARLSPNAQAFVLAARDLQPSFEALRKSVQDSLFANLGEQLRQTAEVVLPQLETAMGGVASELNAAAVNAFEFLRSEEGLRGMNAAFASGANLIRGMRSGTGELTQGLVDLTATAAPRMEEMGRAIAAIGEGIGRAYSRLAETGALDELFGNFSNVLTSLGPFLEGLIVAFGTMGNEVLPALVPFFVTLGDVLEQMAPALGEFGAIFLNSLTSILPSLGQLISALAEGLQPVLPVISYLIKTLADAITPLIEPFSRIAVIVGQALIAAIQALSPALEPLATAFADILNAIAPLVPLIAQNLTVVIQALAPALSQLANALAPVIAQFAEQMRPVIAQIAPVLAQVAGIIAQALVDAINRLAPLLPDLVTAFTNLILAITPLLPTIVELAVSVLPPLVGVMERMIPIIVRLMDAFTWFVNNVLIPVVIPGINFLKDTWQTVTGAIGGSIDWLTGTAFPKVGEALGRLKGWFTDAVSWVQEKWRGLEDAAAGPVNFVIETVWNGGLLKAWGNLDNLLGGVLPDATPMAPIPRRATGGPIHYVHGGSGNGTKDDILLWGSNDEHVVTAAEVAAAGGHNVIYAIRDMILRGIPFTWDGGRIIEKLGRENLERYGAAVAQKGYGNVPPEGLFNALIPRRAQGGPIMPWMHQLKAGHDFARSQHGKPYQWAGPRFVGDSFDCSGFMGSVIAAILGGNVWQRYWATSSFAGYPQVGAQGLVKNLTEGVGMLVGITDDPGGPGGGHTAGELRGIPEMGIPSARVESDGSRGVHYGYGTPVDSFASLYGLPIGANGFFQPSPGGSGSVRIGPSTQEQEGFLRKTIERVIGAATAPVRDAIETVIGPPPPSVRAIPTGVLDKTEKAAVEFISGKVGGLGALLGGAWQKAQDLGDRVLDFVNPFDDGGVAVGTGFLPKNVIEPERVLSPEQTKLFEALVTALQKIATAGLGAAGAAANTVIVDLSQASVEALRTTLGVPARQPGEVDRDEVVVLQERIDAAFTDTGLLISDTVAQLERTQSSTEMAADIRAQQQMDLLLSIAGKLSSDVLGPVMSAAVDAGIGILEDWINGLGKDIVTAVDGTTQAVNNLGAQVDGSGAGGTPTAPAPFGAPGSAFDFASALSDAVVSIANAATAAFQKVANDVVNAALAQTPSRVGSQSRGRLGQEISGGYLIDLIVRLTGVEIEILDLLENTYEEIQSFREGAFSGFDQSGQLISDTAALVQRNQSSIELAMSEQERIQKALIKAVIKYLITAVLIPIITAVLGAMITLATTAIGAAIGSAIPVIGTAIGAAIGAAVGAALSGLASVFTSLLAVGAGAAIDAFDEGGVARGTGMMPKNVIAPERVLSPRQTTAFETFVGLLDRGGPGNRTVQIGSINVSGRDPAGQTNDRLLALLNT